MEKKPRFVLIALGVSFWLTLLIGYVQPQQIVGRLLQKPWQTRLYLKKAGCERAQSQGFKLTQLEKAEESSIGLRIRQVSQEELSQIDKSAGRQGSCATEVLTATSYLPDDPIAIKTENGGVLIFNSDIAQMDIDRDEH